MTIFLTQNRVCFLSGNSLKNNIISLLSITDETRSCNLSMRSQVQGSPFKVIFLSVPRTQTGLLLTLFICPQVLDETTNDSALCQSPIAKQKCVRPVCRNSSTGRHDHTCLETQLSLCVVDPTQRRDRSGLRPNTV